MLTLHFRHLVALFEHSLQMIICPHGRNFTFAGSSLQSSQSSRCLEATESAPMIVAIAETDADGETMPAVVVASARWLWGLRLP